MATDSMVAGLFQDPQQYQQAMLQQQMKQNYDIAGLSPEQQVTGGLRTAGYQLGGAIGGLMGAQDPQMKLQSLRTQILQGTDQTDPASLAKAAQSLNQAGDTQGARQLAQLAQEAAYKQSQITKNNREGNAAMLTTEQRNAAAIANASGADRESPEWANTYKTELTRLTTSASKGANIKEIGVAEGTRQPVYFDVGTDTQFVVKQDPKDPTKQVRVPFNGGVDRTTAKTNVSVDAKGEAAFVQELGKLDAKKVADSFTVRENATNAINSLNKLASLPDKDLITGQFATGRVGATNLLTTLGLASPADANKLATSQQYQKVAGDVILQTLGGKLGAGFSNADREFIASLVPQLETNPEARRKLITFMQGKNQDIIKESTRLETYARQNKGLNGFESKIPLSVAPNGSNPYSGLSDAELAAKIAAAQKASSSVKPIQGF